MTEKCVLIVECRSGIRDVFVDLIQLEGMTSVVAADGKQALDLARDHHPDILLVSLSLSGEMDGLDVIAAVRHDSQLAHLPAVLLISNPLAGALPVIQDDNLLVLKMADLDHLVSALNCLLPSSAWDDEAEVRESASV